MCQWQNFVYIFEDMEKIWRLTFWPTVYIIFAACYMTHKQQIEFSLIQTSNITHGSQWLFSWTFYPTRQNTVTRSRPMLSRKKCQMTKIGGTFNYVHLSDSKALSVTWAPLSESYSDFPARQHGFPSILHILSSSADILWLPPCHTHVQSQSINWNFKNVKEIQPSS